MRSGCGIGGSGSRADFNLRGSVLGQGFEGLGQRLDQGFERLVIRPLFGNQIYILEDSRVHMPQLHARRDVGRDDFHDMRAVANQRSRSIFKAQIHIGLDNPSSVDSGEDTGGATFCFQAGLAFAVGATKGIWEFPLVVIYQSHRHEQDHCTLDGAGFVLHRHIQVDRPGNLQASQMKWGGNQHHPADTTPRQRGRVGRDPPALSLCQQRFRQRLHPWIGLEGGPLPDAETWDSASFPPPILPENRAEVFRGEAWNLISVPGFGGERDPARPPRSQDGSPVTIAPRGLAAFLELEFRGESACPNAEVPGPHRERVRK